MTAEVCTVGRPTPKSEPPCAEPHSTRRVAVAESHASDEGASLVAELDRARARLAKVGRLEAIGQLVAGVAHDFANLLTVITANASVLQEELPHDSELRECIVPIVEAAEQARRITSQLLGAARRDGPTLVPVRANEAVEGFARMLTSLVGTHVRLRLCLDPRVGDILAERTSLEQVLMNLAINARDAMPNGGTLTIETRAASRTDAERAGGALDPAAFCALVVTDTGVGMSHETVARAFEPFFSERAVGRGTGLGLAIVRGVIDHCGGHILVDSAVDRGTSFTLLLPTTREPNVAATQRYALVVHDDEASRTRIRSVLEAQACIVLEARGAEAIAVSEGAPRLDLLVADVTPGSMGEAIARDLGRRHPDVSMMFTSMRPCEHVDVAVGLLRKPLGGEECARLACWTVHTRLTPTERPPCVNCKGAANCRPPSLPPA